MRTRARSTHIVVLTPNPRSFIGRSRNLRQLLPRGEFGAVGVPWDGSSCLVHCQEVRDLRQALVRCAFLVCHDVDEEMTL
jgi:hypothetical protein